MDGDVKHPRELISCARNDIADAERCQRLGMTPSVGTLMRILRQVTNALEAALPGEDDWQYGCDPGPGEFVQACYDRADAAWAVAKRRGSRLVRRRPAGPWEPVKEVPREG